MFDWEDEELEPGDDDAEETDEEESVEEVADEAKPEDEPEPEPVVDPLERLSSLLGDATDTVLVDQVDEKLIAALSPEARGLIKQAVLAARQREEKAVAKSTAEMAKVEGARQALAAERASFTQAQEGFAAMFSNPELREKLDKAKQIDPKTLDLDTDEGKAQAISLEVAKIFGNYVKPLDEKVRATERKAAAQNLREKYAADFKDPAFEAEVNQQITAWEAAGVSVAGRAEDAIARVKVARMQKAETDRREKRRAAAAESARHIGRGGGSGTSVENEEPDAATLRDPARTLLWMREHPKAAERILGRRVAPAA